MVPGAVCVTRLGRGLRHHVGFKGQLGDAVVRR
jgi:hypothetical protein